MSLLQGSCLSHADSSGVKELWMRAVVIIEEDRDGSQTEDWKRVFEGWTGRAEWDLQ